MGTRDVRVDAYIENAAEFAKPILEHLRELIHAASPEIDETMKWSFPHFTYKGILCSMAAFKAHCAFGFWKQSLVTGEEARDNSPMGQFGRITSIADLPPRETLVGYVVKAMQLNEAGVKPARAAAATPRGEVEIPEAFLLALKGNPEAGAAFERFSPSQRREYIEWIAEAKRDETRKRRIDTALEWIAEGKSRNWKYAR